MTSGQPRRRTTSRRREFVAIGVAVVVIVAVGVAAWRLLAPHTSSPAAQPPAAGGQAPVGTSHRARLRAVLTSAAIRGTDLNTGYKVRLLPHGTKVRGQATLDNCGFRFTSERHRVARRQYEVLEPHGQAIGMSNELVAYDNARHARLALAQWRQAARTCPHHPVRSAVAGVPRTTVRVLTNATDARLAMKQNAVTKESIDAHGLGAEYLTAILQVHGRFLDAIWARTPSRPDQRATANLLTLASVTGRRLTAN